MDERRPLRPIVTLAALYGAGGSVVGPRVAERLGVPFLDRGIARVVAAETGLTEASVAHLGDAPTSRLCRFADRMGRLSTVTGEAGGAIERLDLEERAVRSHVEEVLARSADTGAVVLGRGGMVVLRSAPSALHVQLRGPRDGAARQAASMLGIEVDTAARHLVTTDRARMGYVSRVYGVDGDDPSLYDLTLDSTALSLDACVDIIVAAADARLPNLRLGPHRMNDDA